MIGGQMVGEEVEQPTTSEPMSTEPIAEPTGERLNLQHGAASESLPQPQSVEMQTAEPLSSSNAPLAADRAITIEEYKEEYEKLNKYVDEVFKDLESNYKNAFDAIEKQFNQIFDKINQFEDSLKEVLAAPATVNA
jgi:hypothetical protein